MATFRRVPFEEILKRTRSTLEEIEKAFEAGAKFELGVDKTELGFRLTINCRASGIYLYSNAAEFRERYASATKWVAVITPDRVHSGQIVGEAWKGITMIYVLPEDYEQFCQDAQRILELYCHDDLCFRGIPDIWFSDLALVQFIRNSLFSHPTMAPWFAPARISSTGMWLTHPIRGL